MQIPSSKITKILAVVALASFLSLFAGCAVSPKELLTVDFQQDSNLRYNFVSSREIITDWGESQSPGGKTKQTATTSHESMQMVVAYSPIEIDPYGLTTIKATIESVKISRLNKARRGNPNQKNDAVLSLKGQSFNIIVTPTGKIEDYSQLKELIMQTGEKAFRPSSKSRIKEPDMIGDFIATQWFLWDSTSSVKNSLSGVSVGQSWDSILSVPLPMVLKKARAVTYKLEKIEETEKGKIAHITSTYVLAKSVPAEWPTPYTGSFRMSGMFGFLRNYKTQEFSGQGTELFNIDTGQLIKYDQQYDIKMKASMAMPLGSPPTLTIKQKLTMTLLEK